jgi:hypothetical protein
MGIELHGPVWAWTVVIVVFFVSYWLLVAVLEVLFDDDDWKDQR